MQGTGADDQVGMEVSVGAWMVCPWKVPDLTSDNIPGHTTSGNFGRWLRFDRVLGRRHCRSNRLDPIDGEDRSPTLDLPLVSVPRRPFADLSSSLTIVFFIVIWFTNTLVGNAICFAVIGLLSGPVYPVALMEIAEVFDDDIRGGIMGLMGSTGGAGAAICPL